MLTCTVCGAQFDRTGSRGPIPKYCSDVCRAKKQRERPERREYERHYRRRERALGKRKVYEFNYNRRPEVRAKNAERMRVKWHTDPEFRARQLARWRDEFAGITIPPAYHGHRWFDMARQTVNGDRDIDPDFRDYGYTDEVGEALLALLEGRDMDEAVKEFRRKEFIPRHLTLWLSEWKDDPDEDWKEDRYMPSAPSAEDEAVARETVSGLLPGGQFLATAYSHGSNGRPMQNRQQQPSRRRMKDGKSWKRHAA